MLTRRGLLRMGAIGSAVAFAPRFARPGWAQTATTNTVGISAYATQPWMDELKTYYDANTGIQYIANVPLKKPNGSGPGCEDALTPGTMAGPFIEHVPFEGERTKIGTYHQRYSQFRPQNAYEIHVHKTTHQFHKSLKPTTIFGYDGVFPGPLFKARYGSPNLVRFYNHLPADHVGFGSPDISTHLHNAHNASESDGGPWNFFGPGTCWDNHYPNVLAGFSTDPNGKGDPREALGTLWFHDHRQDFTAQNVYAGLAGFYLLYDELDCDDETNPNGLKLPSGNYDVPLVFADKVIGPDYNLKYDFFSMDGILGDKYTVNGKIQPFMRVDRRKYRFRLLNGGPSRVYSFGLSNNAPMWLIANDGNLLPVARKRAQVNSFSATINDYLLMGVAERMDIIIDFSQYAPGTEIYLNNYCEQINGAEPTEDVLRRPTPVLKFIVGEYPETPDQSIIPNAAGLATLGRSTMRDLPDVDLQGVVRRRWDFGRSNGAWMVNGAIFDANVCSATVTRGAKEVWTFRSGGGWWHPVHVHMEEHQILSRRMSGDTFTYPYEGRKDVATLRGSEDVEAYFRFRDWLGKYPMHCHNVVHEDHAMMVRFDLVDRNARRTEPSTTE